MVARLKSFFKEYSALNLLLIAIVFYIPLAWSRQLNANYVSAKFFLLYLVSAISLLVSFRQLIIPQLSKFLWTIFIALFALHLIAPLISGRPTDYIYLSKFLAFCAMSYYFYTRKTQSMDQVFNRVTYLVFTTVVLILTFALMDFYKFRIVDLNLQSGYLLGSFGNVNMMSEFLVLTTPFIFYWVRFKDRVPILVKIILFTAWIFFIMYCRSRSTWIGLGLWATWEMFRGGRRKDLIALPIAMALYFFAMNTHSVPKDQADVKKDSFKERVSLYKATAELIKDSPLGVGLSHFDSYLVPYQHETESKPNEYLHYDQPHSEILRWTAQLGWFGILLVMGAAFSAMAVLFRRKKEEKPEVSVKKNFLIASVLVLAPQVLFQFPYHNPASILYLSFTFSLFLSLFSVRNEILLKWKMRVPIFILSIFGVLHAFAFVTSIYYESTQNEDFEKISFACAIYPINQNACFLKTYHLIKDRKFKEARNELQWGFDRFLYHRGLLRLLPSYLKNTSSDKNTCEAVLVYQLLFPAQKFFDAGVMKSCVGFSSPITYKNPAQLNADYQYWLNRLLQ